MLVAIEDDCYKSDLVNYISVNEKIPLEFNIFRFLVVFGILLINYFVKKLEIFNSNYSIKDIKQEGILIGILAVFLIILSFLNSYSSEEKGDAFKTNKSIYNQELVDALYNKQLYLIQEPTEKFKNLENPYDPLSRSEVIRDIDYKWDTAYYNGHHYINIVFISLLISLW